MAARPWHGSVWRHTLMSWVGSRQQLGGVESSRGSISQTTWRTCGLVIRGNFFPSNLVQAQQKSSAKQAQGHVGAASPLQVCTRPGPTSLFRSQTAFLYANGEPPTYARVSNGVSGSKSFSLVVAWDSGAMDPLPAVDGPVDLAGLAPAGRSHPLGAEKVSCDGPWLSATVISRQEPTRWAPWRGSTGFQEP